MFTQATQGKNFVEFFSVLLLFYFILLLFKQYLDVGEQGMKMGVGEIHQLRKQQLMKQYGGRGTSIIGSLSVACLF